METVDRQRYDQNGADKKAGISTNAIAHTDKNEGVHVEALAKICVALNWMTNDII